MSQEYQYCCALLSQVFVYNNTTEQPCSEPDCEKTSYHKFKSRNIFNVNERHNSCLIIRPIGYPMLKTYPSKNMGLLSLQVHVETVTVFRVRQDSPEF